MKMRKLNALLLAFGLAGATTSFAQQFDAETVRQEIGAVISGLQTMKCDFVQTKEVAMLSDKLVSKGRLYFQQPSKLRWEYTTPYQYVFILNDTQVFIRQGNRSDTIDINQSAVFKEIARIMMNSVTGKCLTDDKDFTSAIADSDGEYIATLTPLRKDMKKMFKTIILHFDKETFLVMSVELVELSGDCTLIELKNITTNESVPQSAFSVD